VIVPSNLRKQWYQELTEKFFLPCVILETKPYNEAIKKGIFKPFEVKDAVVICSYHFARSKAADVANTPWNLVVIDEAHRLRNVYKPNNVIYQRCRKPEEIKTAFDQLQLELSFEINEAMTQTKQKLLENFDDDVRNKLRVRDAAAKDFLDRYEQLIAEIESKLQQRISQTRLFSIRWKLA
jgi:hypothetical protein